MSEIKVYKHSSPFKLECGVVLPELEITYTDKGDPSSPVVWICHALTANADPEQWWPGLVGDNKLLNSKTYRIVCANILGSCYGTTGPASFDGLQDKIYGADFPLVTIRDIVAAHQLLQKYLGIEKIYFSAGGSLGGQQVVEWAIQDPYLFENIALLSTNAKFSPWGIAFNEAQRMAVRAGIREDGTINPLGLEAARGLAMISYRNYITFEQRQSDPEDKIDDFMASSYQRYQGTKLSKRFDAYSYIALSKAMDSHNVGRGRGGLPHALSMIKANTVVIGINTDILFISDEQKHLADYIPRATFDLIHSDFGHDGFLLEFERIETVLQHRLNIN